MKYVLALLTLIALPQIGYNQFEERKIDSAFVAIQEVHQETAVKVIGKLQYGLIEDAKPYFSDEIDSLDFRLEILSKTLQDFYARTSSGYYFVDDYHDYSLLRYFVMEEGKFLFNVDVYFDKTDPNSKIIGYATLDQEGIKKALEYTWNDDEMRVLDPPPNK